MPRMQEEMKADHLLPFLPHLLLNTPLLGFESKAMATYHFTFLKGQRSCRTLPLASQEDPFASTWLSLGETSFYHLSSSSQAFVYTRTSWGSTFQFQIWFSCSAVGNWVHLAFNDLGAEGLGKLCRPPPTQQAGASDVQVLCRSPALAGGSWSRCCVNTPGDSVLHCSHTCFSSSSKSLRIALRQSTHSRCFDIMLWRKPLTFGVTEGCVVLGNFPV